jgi:hypothetical protein
MSCANSGHGQPIDARGMSLNHRDVSALSYVAQLTSPKATPHNGQTSTQPIGRLS